MKYDFGEWNVPTKWEDVTLGQVIAIDKERALEKPSLASIIAILCGKSVDEVEQLPVEFVESIISKMSFIQEQPQVSASCSCVIDGERYSVNAKEKLTFGEWVAFNMIQESGDVDVAKILAVVCRKDGEAYTSEFENNVFPERVKMFRDASCMKTLPIVAFFLNLYALSAIPSQRSFLKEEAQSLIQRILGTSAKNGRGKELLTRWQKRKLRGLSKYIDSI